MARLFPAQARRTAPSACYPCLGPAMLSVVLSVRYGLPGREGRRIPADHARGLVNADEQS